MRKVHESKYRQYYEELSQSGDITLTFSTEEEAHSFRNSVQHQFRGENLSTSLGSDRVTVTEILKKAELV